VFLMLALAAFDFAETFSRAPYLGPWLLLLACGLGAPLPEEAALIPAGVMLADPDLHLSFLHMALVCSSGILIGDSLPFLLGKRYGLSVLKLRWVSKILHPERFATFERRFSEHGNWATFTCRFLPGLRIPGYFIAGSLKMSYLRFLLLDGLGILISVPTSIFLAKWAMERFGEAQAKREVHMFMIWIAVAVVSIVLIYVVGRAWRRRRASPPTP
jgi:membrane protein DedA with SNARE-associated domain